MAVRVLIVDDSGFFRKRIEQMLQLDPKIQVVGTASNGIEAVQKAASLKPDVITMDVEMPGMNGIEAVRQIMQKTPTQVLMLSSLTHEGARVTLQALEAGAADYLPKEASAWISHQSELQKDLVARIYALGTKRTPFTHTFANPFSDRVGGGAGSASSRVFTARPDDPVPSPRQSAPVEHSAGTKPATGGAENRTKTTQASSIRVPDFKILVIDSSTGGPAALQQILTQLPANFPVPILIAQHMPRTFTQVFAERLNKVCKISVKEAENGDELKPGRALLAPGGLQMIIDPRSRNRVSVLEGDANLTYKPSVDVCYASVARVFGKQSLAVILTGMGADGCEGARLLKREGAQVWAQNEASCTIYGMPAAVVKAGLADQILDLNDIGPLLARRGG